VSKVPERLPLIKRTKWATRNVSLTPLPVKPATHVFVHHAVSGIEGSDIDLDNDGLPDQFEDILRQIEAFHMDVRGWRAIAYNIMVSHKGYRAEGRGWGIEGGATGGWADDQGISICAVGNYHNGVHKVTAQLIRAIVTTIADGIEQGHLVGLNQLTILGHQQKPYATACPGSGLMKIIPTLPERVEKELKRPSRRTKRQIKKLQNRIKKIRGRIRKLRNS
jgi:hypothetical protein